MFYKQTLRPGAAYLKKCPRRIGTFTRHARIHPSLYAFVGITLIYGVYKYVTWSPYNEPTKKHLRKALLGHHYDKPGDPEVYYLEAIEEAIKSGFAKDSEEVLGVYLLLADFYRDKRGNKDKALPIYEMLISAWWKKGEPDIEAQENQALRKALGMAQNIADIYASANLDSAAEDFYKWSLELLLGTPEPLYSLPGLQESAESSKAAPTAPDHRSQGAESSETQTAEIPVMRPKPWSTPRDLGSCLLAMAQFYHSRKNVDLALPLYIRSLETIENDTTKSWFGADKDILLNKIYIMINIADALLYKNNVTYARRWANGALNTVMGASHAAELKEPHAAALVCMGSVHEKSSEFEEAKRLCKQALDLARENGFPHIKKAALNCLNSCERGIKGKNSEQT